MELHGQHLIFPAMMCDNMYKVLTTRDTHWSLEARIFIGSPSQAWSTYMTLLFSLLPSRVQTDRVWPKDPDIQGCTFSINQIVSINYLVWPKVSGIQRHSNQARYSKDSEVTSQEMLKCQSWRHLEWVRFGKPRPYEFSLYCTWIPKHLSRNCISLSIPV